jgi:hypothetical protein
MISRSTRRRNSFMRQLVEASFGLRLWTGSFAQRAPALNQHQSGRVEPVFLTLLSSAIRLVMFVLIAVEPLSKDRAWKWTGARSASEIIRQCGTRPGS